jgi:protein phosphatase 1 regulatory subunit 42
VKVFFSACSDSNKCSCSDACCCCVCLQKLYLQGNCLASIDHLSACSRLEELHVSDQQWQQQEGSRGPRPLAVEQQQHEHLQQLESSQQAASQHSNVGSSSSSSSTTGQVPDMQLGRTTHLQSASSLTAAGLQFELASLQAISGSLRVLCAANCGIQDPGPLAVLQKLHTLDLSGNSIQQLALLQPVLQRLQRLRVLDVRGNPCLQHELKYRDYMILLAADSLETLDNEAVSASHRAFLLGLHLKKLKAQERSEEQQQQQQLARKQQGQQLFLPQGISGKPAAGACAAAPSGGLSGAGVTLHSMKAPAVRPTAAGGFNASGARIAAALGGTRGRNGVDAAASAEHV